MELISGVIIVNSDYIGTSFVGLILEVKLKRKNTIQFLQKTNYINKVDRTSHWVVHSYFKELDTNYFFKR